MQLEYTTQQQRIEEWRIISRFPAYDVSSHGRVRRVLPGPGYKGRRILKERVKASGYVNVRLNRQEVRVHRLVAEEFIGPFESGMNVNHVDANKRNNCYWNLEYVTPRQNAIHAAKLGLMRKKLSAIDVRIIRRLKGLLKSREACKPFGIGESTVRKIWCGEIWSHTQ